MGNTPATELPTKVLISYSLENDDHRNWTREFATRLRNDGVDVKLDQWDANTGDQLPHLINQSIAENDCVLIICTPNYKSISDSCQGGVGHEGTVITGDILMNQDHSKFIPILRDGDSDNALPTALKGNYTIDLRGEPYSEQSYTDLLTTINRVRQTASSHGKRKIKVSAAPVGIVDLIIDPIGQKNEHWEFSIDGENTSQNVSIPNGTQATGFVMAGRYTIRAELRYEIAVENVEFEDTSLVNVPANLVTVRSSPIIVDIENRYHYVITCRHEQDIPFNRLHIEVAAVTWIEEQSNDSG